MGDDDIDYSQDMQFDEHQEVSLLEVLTFIGGKLAIQCFVRALGAPFHRTQVLLQCKPKRYRGMVSCMKEVAETEGIWGGLMRTAGPQCVSTVASPIMLALLRGVVHPDIAGLGVTFVMYPIETAVTLISLDTESEGSRRKYNGFIHCIRTVATEKGVHQLYRGFLAFIATGYVYRITYIVLHNTMADYVEESSPLVQWIGSLVVAEAASAVAYVFETCRRRMLVDTDKTRSTLVTLANTIRDGETTTLLDGFVAQMTGSWWTSTVMAIVQNIVA